MTTIPTLSAAEFITKMIDGEKPVVIDLRPAAEYKAAHFADARTINLQPYDIHADKLKALFPDPDTPLHFLCLKGENSKEPTRRAVGAGYGNAVSIEGGFRVCEKMGVRMEATPVPRPPAPR